MIKTSPTNPKGYAVEPFAAADGDFELEALTEQEAAQEFYSRHGLDDSEVMDESDIVRKAVRETARRYREHMMGVFTLLHKSRSGGLQNLDKMLDVLTLGHGFYSIVGCSSSTELAVRHGCGDPNINKTLNEVQRKLGLPPMPGQRDTDGRIAMGKKGRENWCRAEKKK